MIYYKTGDTIKYSYMDDYYSGIISRVDYENKKVVVFNNTFGLLEVHFINILKN